LELAEAIQSHLREHKMTTLATYKTLMKVYATCDLLDRACDLYGDICADGIVPDGIMRGCLVKFAVKCGREQLSADLLQATAGQAQDPQTYIQLIRAAGQKQDVDRAISLLRQLQASTNEAIEAPVFNCVLDVCMANAKFDAAEQILNEMREGEKVTLVTYNTLMKGYAGRGDFSRAMHLLAEAQSAGLQADQSSFNCLISAAVSTGKHDHVWTVFDTMQKSGLEADNFTLSILMKLIRKTNNRRDTVRALAVLDGCEADIVKDDVLFNSVLDACIHLKDAQRLSWVLKQFEAASIKPSVQNYGLIIKAYACLKRVDKCWLAWQDMTQVREMVPTDVALSCMLDAVVTAGRVDEAVALFRQWESVVPPNTIIYSNLIKGFAAIGDAERAMEMYSELKSRGLPMNIVVYSTLIDAQAKSGNPSQAQDILLQMEEDGCKPNTITYSSLLKAYCVKGDLEGALKVFEDMVSKGLKPDTVVFNTLLDGAVRCSQFSICDQIVTEMSNAGVEASCFTLSIVVKMWGKRRKLDRAFGAVREAVKTGRSRLDSKLCTCLISACFHNQQPKRALEALEEMKSWPRCDGPDNGTYEQLMDGLLRSRCTVEAATVALEATDLASRGSIKPLSVGHLRQLFKSLQQGNSHELLLELRNKLRAASLPLP
jgi:pentatricopeptide repeat protein